MKNLLILFFGLLYISCKEKKIISKEPELIVAIEVKQEFDSIFILNKIQNAIKYDLDYGDGTKLIGDTTLHNNTIGINGGSRYRYKKDGTYTIILTAYDKNEKSKTVSVQIVIDYIKKNTPTADFSLKFLDAGIVQMTNLSKNYTSLDIGVRVGNWGYNTKEENPTFEFDMNGKYKISLGANTEFYDEKNVEIEIKNIADRELGYFKGEWLGKKIDIQEGFNNQNVTYYMDIGSGNTYLLLKNIFSIDGNNYIQLTNFKVKTDSLKTNSMKYEQIKSKFKVGIQKSEDWAISGLLPLSNSMNNTVEILEIKEVSQRKLIPEMYDKAFWVTFKIKADFGNGNNIDGTLKVRYLIY